MSEHDTNESAPKATNITSIGSVTGQVHTGSGNIIVSSFTANTMISTKEEFLSALRGLRQNWRQFVNKDFLKNPRKIKPSWKVETAEEEAAKDKPRAETIAERLEKAKSILLAGTGIATATAAAVTAVGKLLLMIDTAIKYVGSVFH